MDLNYLLGISVAGIISGIFAGLIGGGAEIVIVPLLTFLVYFHQLNIESDNIIYVITSCGYLRQLIIIKEYVDIYAALYMGILFTLFASLSANYSTQLDIKILRRFLGFLQYYVEFIFIFQKRCRNNLKSN